MNRFNIRVYGICIENQQLLLSDEIRFGMKMTKLPGGGLEFGEGTVECLIREWQEELAADIQVGEIVYVNPFVQISAINNKDQVLCLYYEVKLLGPLKVPLTNRPWDFPSEEGDQQVFRWVPLRDLRAEDFTFPIDQSLVPVLKKYQQTELENQ